MSAPFQRLPESRFRSGDVVPPTLLPVAPAQIPTPDPVLPRARVPVASVPRKLPTTRLFAVPSSWIWMPLPALPEMTLRAPGSVPPTMLPEAPWAIATPSPRLARPLAAGRSVPTRFPATTLPEVPASVEVDAVPAVPGDQISQARPGPADGVARGPAADRDAVDRIAQAPRARSIGAQGVPLDEVADGPDAEEEDPVLAVGRDEVPADRVPRRAAPDGDADSAIAHRQGACGIGPDEIVEDRSATPGPLKNTPAYTLPEMTLPTATTPVELP